MRWKRKQPKLGPQANDKLPSNSQPTAHCCNHNGINLLTTTPESPSFVDPKSREMDKTSAASTPKPSPFSRRYYSYALSKEDKEALRSEQQQREWAADDVVAYRNRRNKMTIQGFGHLKSAKVTVDDNPKREGELRQLTSEMEPGSPYHGASKDNPSREVMAHGISAISKDLPCSDPASPERHSSPTTTTSESATPKNPPGDARSATSNISNYLKVPEASVPSKSNGSRIKPPPKFQPNPEATFDSMLTTHVSGKGEAFRGAENAVKDGEQGQRLNRKRSYMILGGRQSRG